MMYLTRHTTNGLMDEIFYLDLVLFSIVYIFKIKNEIVCSRFFCAQICPTHFLLTLQSKLPIISQTYLVCLLYHNTHVILYQNSALTSQHLAIASSLSYSPATTVVRTG